MAAQVISNGPAHFTSGPEIYSPNLCADYSVQGNYQSTYQSAYMYNNDGQNPSFNIPDNWASNSNVTRRIASRSPNIASSSQERTPIRHHQNRHSVSRTRSVSKSDALLAYATEQSMQQATNQNSVNTTPSLSRTSSATSPMMFTSQAYASPSIPASYIQHHPYYGNSGPPYQDIGTQAVNATQIVPAYYAGPRAEAQVSSMAGAAFNGNDSMYLPNQAPPRPAAMAPMAPPPQTGYSSSHRTLESTSANIEASTSRNKPQCWEHGCNGRQFSTFSNLLRHQREKSGTAAKARCPHCGTEFTRTTARNGHMYGGKCKGLADAGGRSPPPGGSADS